MLNFTHIITNFIGLSRWRIKHFNKRIQVPLYEYFSASYYHTHRRNFFQLTKTLILHFILGIVNHFIHALFYSFPYSDVTIYHYSCGSFSNSDINKAEFRTRSYATPHLQFNALTITVTKLTIALIIITAITTALYNLNMALYLLYELSHTRMDRLW